MSYRGTVRTLESDPKKSNISDAAKFEKVYKYLRSDDEGLKYFEFLTDADYSGLYRDDFLEVLVTARFSKMKELTDSVKKIAELATVLESFTDQQILDKKTNEAIQGFSALGQMKSGKEIACVFEFEDGLHPLVAYLDDIKKLPLNRSQRRNMPKNMDNPAELRDVIKGPALVVLPIAVYQ